MLDSVILDLGNGDNFSLQYTISIPSTPIVVQGQDFSARITEVTIPVIFDSPILLVNISTSVPIGSRWDFAGNLNQVAPTVFGDALVEKRALFLRRRNLVIFSQLKGDYKITYLPPKWFADVTMTIYQYEGVIGNEVEIDLDTIETKLDALIA